MTTGRGDLGKCKRTYAWKLPQGEVGLGARGPQMPDRVHSVAYFLCPYNSLHSVLGHYAPHCIVLVAIHVHAPQNFRQLIRARRDARCKIALS